MAALFLLILTAALCIQVWKGFTEGTKQAIIAETKKLMSMIQDGARKARNRILRRRMAYKHLFLAGQGKRELNPEARVVVADLMKFCRVLNTTIQTNAQGSVDPIASAVAEGRREVALHIFKELNLDVSDLMQIAMDDPLAA